MRSEHGRDEKQRHRPGYTPFRPVSLMILAAIVVVLFAGLNYVFVKDNPSRLAGFLMMILLFFFIAAVLAIDDIGRIITKSLTRRNQIYRDTLGDKEFRDELREEVHRHLQEDDTPADE